MPNNPLSISSLLGKPTFPTGAVLSLLLLLLLPSLQGVRIEQFIRRQVPVATWQALSVTSSQQRSLFHCYRALSAIDGSSFFRFDEAVKTCYVAHNALAAGTIVFEEAQNGDPFYWTYIPNRFWEPGE